MDHQHQQRSRSTMYTGTYKDQARARMNTRLKRNPGQRSGVSDDGTRWILKGRDVKYLCIGRSNTCKQHSQHGIGGMCCSCAARIENSPYRLEWSETIGGKPDRVRCLLKDNRTGQLCGRTFNDLRAFKHHVNNSNCHKPPRLWTDVANDQRQAIDNRAPVNEQAAPSTNSTAAEEHEFEDEAERPEEEQPTEQDVDEPRSIEHDALVARLEADIIRLRTENAAELTRRSDEHQRERDELNRAREDAEKRCHDREAELQAAALEHHRVNTGRNELIEQSRVAHDNRVKISEECGQLKEKNRRLEEMDAEKETKIRSLTNEMETMHGQLEEKRTLQAELDDALSRKNGLEKNICDVEKSKGALATQLDEQRLELEKMKDALGEAARGKERSDIDYNAVKSDLEREEAERERVDAELKQLREKLRVATDDGVKFSDECRAMSKEVQTLHGQLVDAAREKQTLQSELDNASMSKKEMEKTIRDLEKSKGDLAQHLEEQRLHMAQLQDALRETKITKERLDVDYETLKTEIDLAVRNKEADRQRVDAELLKLREELRVATDNGMHISVQCRQLEDEKRCLEDDARRKSQTDEEKIAFLTNDMEILRGQLEKRTVQAELERDKRDEEHKKAVQDLISLRNLALQEQRHYLEKRHEEVESRLAETRTKLIESEMAKAEALVQSDKLQEVLDEKDGVVRDALAEKKTRYEFFKKWTDEERRIFNAKLAGKKFKRARKVQKEFLKEKTMKDIVQYYYYTKEKRYKETDHTTWEPNKDAGRCTNKESEWEDNVIIDVPDWSEPEKSPMVEYSERDSETRINL